MTKDPSPDPDATRWRSLRFALTGDASGRPDGVSVQNLPNEAHQSPTERNLLAALAHK
ncbi:hypothetical protein [Mastigocladopsis repens]|uniref:hypothetical protein n=1 Tax=Mastigocladopsis repens TaxID=221287 RepID=UPI0002FEE438|nr:hypothetical protein [Mastigocladopsis repens]